MTKTTMGSSTKKKCAEVAPPTQLDLDPVMWHVCYTGRLTHRVKTNSAVFFQVIVYNIAPRVFAAGCIAFPCGQIGDAFRKLYALAQKCDSMTAADGFGLFPIILALLSMCGLGKLMHSRQGKIQEFLEHEEVPPRPCLSCILECESLGFLSVFDLFLYIDGDL